MTQNLDLNAILGEITKTLVENQQTLNEADKSNHNHGDNMVMTFKTAQKAISTSKDEPVAQQLHDIAARLQKTSKSGSGQIYAEGFERASVAFKGKSIDSDTIGTLIESLMGSEKPAQAQQGNAPTSQAGSGDLLSTLLGSLTGTTTQQPQAQTNQGGDLLTTLLGGLTGSGQQTQPQQNQGTGDLLTSLLGGLTNSEEQEPQQNSGGGLLGSLLGGLTGGGASSTKEQTSGDLIGTLLGGLSGSSKNSSTSGKEEVNVSDLLSKALKYYAAKQQGNTDLEAIVIALSQTSPLGSTPERAQSGALVIQTLLNMLVKSN